jgi:hypothetical protein
VLRQQSQALPAAKQQLLAALAPPLLHPKASTLGTAGRTTKPCAYLTLNPAHLTVLRQPSQALQAAKQQLLAALAPQTSQQQQRSAAAAAVQQQQQCQQQQQQQQQQQYCCCCCW